MDEWKSLSENSDFACEEHVVQVLFVLCCAVKHNSIAEEFYLRWWRTEDDYGRPIYVWRIPNFIDFDWSADQ